MSALNKQVGGNHYKDCAIQPIEYIHANKLGFIEGCVVKYITRWRSKGGIQDLEKIRHFVDLLLELEMRNDPQRPLPGIDETPTAPTQESLLPPSARVSFRTLASIDYSSTDYAGFIVTANGFNAGFYNLSTLQSLLNNGFGSQASFTVMSRSPLECVDFLKKKFPLADVLLLHWGTEGYTAIRVDRGEKSAS